MPPQKRSKTPRNGTRSRKLQSGSDWTVLISDQALEEIEELSKTNQDRVLKFIYGRLIRWPNPRQLGEALTGPLAGNWRYRVGDIRIICRIEDGILRILVIKIGHRREVYR